ncbi:MAG: co-chaperone GroES [bacterium]|nr:co-chaperone GroES [bacterium]
MAIKPIGDRLLVQVEEEESAAKVGSLYVPDSAKEKPQKGKVVAVGEGYRDGDKIVPLTVKAGDVVLYSKYSGTEIKYEDVEYLILQEMNVLAIID